MRIGELDGLITIKRRSVVRDDIGGEVVAWVTRVADLWAKVHHVSGAERIRANQEIVVADALFTIHHRGDVVETDRIEYDGRVYEVTHLAPRGRNMWLEVAATKVKA